jgi:hypothetical protein
MVRQAKRLLIAAPVACALAAFSSPALIAMADVPPAPTISVTTTLDPSLVSGEWWVNLEDTTRSQPLKLASGLATHAGSLTVSLPLAPLLTTAHVEFLTVHAERIIDNSHAQVMSASLGLSPSMRSAGATYTLASPVVGVAPVVAFQPSAASSSQCTGQVVCCPSGINGFVPPGTTCEAYEWEQEAEAYRGFAYHIYGSKTTFSVNTENTQEWDNGVRFDASPTFWDGAFSVDGHTEQQRVSTNGTDDTWPIYGDPQWIDINTGAQIAPADPASGDNVLFGAQTSTYRNSGLDRWHFSHQIHAQCSAVISPLTCYQDYQDHIYDTANLGGTNTKQLDASGYYADAAQIRAQQHGNWTYYLPGSLHTTTQQSSTTLTKGIEIKWSWDIPGAIHGSVDFTSSETNKSLSLVKNSIQFRSLPWLYKFYGYDENYNGAVFAHEYYSCEWATGYANACGAYGCTPPCTNYGQ